VIHIRVPSVPPSVNHAYSKKRGGGRVLTKAGKKYKLETKTWVARHYPSDLKFFKPNDQYVMLIEFTFKGRETLMCKGWPDKAQNRHKSFDVTNRTKLFEDAFSDAVGVDDKDNFFVGVGKTWHRDYEETRAWVWNRNEQPDNPIDALIRELKFAAGGT
jgi:hypothetical protein